MFNKVRNANKQTKWTFFYFSIEACTIFIFLKLSISYQPGNIQSITPWTLIPQKYFSDSLVRFLYVVNFLIVFLFYMLCLPKYNHVGLVNANFCLPASAYSSACLQLGLDASSLSSRLCPLALFKILPHPPPSTLLSKSPVHCDYLPQPSRFRLSPLSSCELNGCFTRLRPSLTKVPSGHFINP